MNIVLIGYRGTGKSTIARELGARLGREVVSMDAEIVRRAGCAIPEIVARHGWEHFRDLESALAAELGRRDGLIVDAGGGVIVRSANVAALKANGVVFWLEADVATIIDRIGGDDQRPSLSGARSFVDEVADILAERTPKYRAAADHIVNTAELSAAEAVAAIDSLLTRACPLPDSHPSAMGSPRT